MTTLTQSDSSQPSASTAVGDMGSVAASLLELKALFDSAPVGIMFTHNRVVVQANVLCAEMLRCTLDALIGMPASGLWPDAETYAELGRQAGPVLASGQRFQTEMQGMRQDRTLFWCRFSAKAVNPERTQDGTLWILEDVSERRDAQAALHQANEALEARVADLKRTQADLVQAEKLASLGSMVAGIAHELNTPLGNALMSASTLHEHMCGLQAAVAAGELRRSALDTFLSDGVATTELVLRSCDRAAQLVNSFKQVAVDQTSEQRRVFELRDLVGDILSTLKPMYRHEPWTIVANLASGMPCDSYPGPLGQVISNLVSNAVIHAFAGRDHGVLRITAALRDGSIEMCFTDDGLGMDSGRVTRIFDPFFTTRLGHGGSGLGLSISRNIATGLLGGTLSVRSEPGQGACFTLKFPAVAPLAPG